jgi:hypothetical protein
LAFVATERTSLASGGDRAIDYGVPLAFVASAQALESHYPDVAEGLRLASPAVLMLPVWSARTSSSAAFGLGALVLAEGAEVAALACTGTDCRAAVSAAGLGSYSAAAAIDVATLASEPMEAPYGFGSTESRWYGWRPLIAYSMLTGGAWLATIDRVGVSGAGYAVASSGLAAVPVSHWSAGRHTHGWMAFGGTLLGASIGTAAACARGCESPFNPRSARLLEPNKALFGATLGIAGWGLLDAALLSYREDRSSPNAGSAVTPMVTTSPTTGRPRVAVSVEF